MSVTGILFIAFLFLLSISIVSIGIKERLKDIHKTLNRIADALEKNQTDNQAPPEMRIK